MTVRKLSLLVLLLALAALVVFLDLRQAAQAGTWISFEPSKADCVVAKRRNFRYRLQIAVGHQGYDWVMGTAYTPANSPNVEEGVVVPTYHTVTADTELCRTKNSGKLMEGASWGNFQTSAWGFPQDAEGNMSFECWGIHDAYITTRRRECR